MSDLLFVQIVTPHKTKKKALTFVRVNEIDRGMTQHTLRQLTGSPATAISILPLCVLRSLSAEGIVSVTEPYTYGT